MIEYEFEFHILRLLQSIKAKRNSETTCDCVHKLQQLLKRSIHFGGTALTIQNGVTQK